MSFSRLPRGRWLPVWLPVLFVVLASAATADPVVIQSPAEPAQGRVTLEGTPLWQVGGYGDSDADFLGYVSDIVVDEQGHAYLLDQQLHEVKAFDPDGDHLATFGRQGEGPGEFFRPRGLVMMPDGQLGVLNGRPTRIALYGTDGTIGGDVRIGEGETMGFIMNAVSRNGHLAVDRTTFTMGDNQSTSTRMIAALGADGSIAQVYAEKSETQPMSGGRRGIRISIGGGDFIETWTLGPDGRVYLVPTGEAYEIEVYAPDGTHESTIRRDYERVRRTGEEMDRIRQERSEMAERFGNEVQPVSEFRNDIDRIFVRDDGELWVMTSQGEAERDGDTLGTFDVFGPDGKFVRQVEVRVPFEEGKDEYMFRGDGLFVVEESIGAMQNAAAAMGMMIRVEGAGEPEEDEEPEPLTVIRYRLTEKPGR